MVPEERNGMSAQSILAIIILSILTGCGETVPTSIDSDHTCPKTGLIHYESFENARNVSFTF